MTCTWCPNVATEGGRAPAGVSGLQFVVGCDLHKNKIEKLKYIPMKPDDIEAQLKREAKQNK